MTLISSLKEKLSIFSDFTSVFCSIVISLSFLNELSHRLLRSLSQITVFSLICTLFVFKKNLLVFSVLLAFVLLIICLFLSLNLINGRFARLLMGNN